MTREQLEIFLKTHHRTAYLWARQCCQFDSLLAEDVLQIALLKILEGKAVFNGHSEEKTWLFSVIRFTAYEQMRKREKHLSWEAIPETFIKHDQPETEPKTDYQESMLLQLPYRQREVLLLVFYHGKSLEEVAGVLNISKGSVSTHYDRGKKRLREIIEKQNIITDGNI